MLRSFTVIDPHLVNVIRENPRYTKMTLEEILGKFVSGHIEREMCPWTISISILVIRCPTH
jgi:hypothetical protein